MKKIRVNYVFRKRGEGHNSIEELFHSIISHLPEHIDPHIVELPYSGASLKAVVLNIWHVLFLKGVIHVTGDVYYIGLIPFKKTILTIHDVHFIKGTWVKRLFLKLFWLMLPAFFSKKITLISKFSADEFLKLVPWVKRKIKIIYNPVNPLLETKPKAISSPPKILHLGTKQNKNLINTIKGLSNVECRLIILGPLTTEQKEALLKYNTDYENYVGLPFSEIKRLYERCDLVSFISLYEGFGMPIIEAQKVGRVVVTSKMASIPEIAGKGAYFVDALDVINIEKGFKLLLEEKLLVDNITKQGFVNVDRFNMGAIVQQYVQLYDELN